MARRKKKKIEKELAKFAAEEKHKKRSALALALQVATAVTVAAVCVYSFAVIASMQEANSKTSWVKTVKSYEEYERQGIKVLAETDEAEEDSPFDQSLKSENYTMKQVLIGGEILTEVENVDSTAPLNIADIKNELFVAKNKDEIKMLVTWKTSKNAKSSIEFSKDGESSKKKIETNSSGFSHTAVLPALEPSSVYTYTITCKDRWGMEKTSDKFVFYTGAPNVSLMDVLEDAAKKVFGWAM